MLKCVWTMEYRDGVSPEEGLDHWRNVHGPLIAAVPGVVKYIQNRKIDEMAPGFDGVAELFFADREAYENALTTPEWQAAVDDAGTFLKADEFGAAVMEEVVLRGEAH